ncbi:2116_t:CDS:2 [Paraglomus occultum]|uniref:2116_t:CDS:1 n=1 Tax=Paraglomus occultum TaxID=144539 RepID=A0A9N9B943_9GLOM|nr:2116_t:CDS:2 [Paraglomus occultum]
MVESIEIRHEDKTLPGDFYSPTKRNAGIVIFVHGSGSSRFSPRFVAEVLRSRGVGMFLLDLLTPQEEAIDESTRHLRFDIEMLSQRVASAIDYFAQDNRTQGLPIGLFGASTGGGAALLTASLRPNQTATVVSRGGRPDLVPVPVLQSISTPTLFVVGSKDTVVLELNNQALNALGSKEKRLQMVEGATHLFEEKGTVYVGLFRLGCLCWVVYVGLFRFG